MPLAFTQEDFLVFLFLTHFQDADIHLHIMKDASYLGALGAFLYQNGKEGDQAKT